MEHKVVSDYTSVTVQGENIKVFVRERPPADGAPPNRRVFEVDKADRGQYTMRNPDNTSHGEHAFRFDHVFPGEVEQKEVYESACRPLVSHVLHGFNACCFAYGQTGSGKTFSMFGEPGERRGLIPRAMEQLFAQADRSPARRRVSFVVTFLEIYCDHIRDLGRAYLEAKVQRAGAPSKARSTSEWLLEPGSRGHFAFGSSGPGPGEVYGAPVEPRAAVPGASEYAHESLTIHEDAEGGVFVKDACVIPVTSVDEVMTIVQLGFRLRATFETRLNAVSSRSHTVFTVNVAQEDPSTGDVIRGALNLVDLAGSERLTKSDSSGQRMREALSINRSLSALGKVVVSLAPEAGDATPPHIPYRDSKLTRLLQNSLGGNSYTVLLATIHPMPPHYDETLSTVQFANRCRNVKNIPRVNYAEDEVAGRRVKRLLRELQQLRAQLSSADGRMRGAVAAVMADLGVPGEPQPDGTFRLPDGFVLGARGHGQGGGDDGAKGKEPAASVDEVLSHVLSAIRHAEGRAPESSAAAATSGDGASSLVQAIQRGRSAQAAGGAGYGSSAAADGGGGGAAPSVTSLCAELERERRTSHSLREKLAERNTQVRRLDQRLQSEAQRLQGQVAAARHRARDLEAELASSGEAMKSKLELAQSRHAQQLRELVSHSREVMADQDTLHTLRQQTSDASLPRPASGQRLRPRSGALRLASSASEPDVEQRAHALAAQRISDAAEKASRSADTRVRQAEQQYSAWCREAAEECERRVGQAEAALAQEQEQHSAVAEEARALFDHYRAACTLLDQLRKGEVPVTTQRGVGLQFCLSPSALPPDPASLTGGGGGGGAHAAMPTLGSLLRKGQGHSATSSAASFRPASASLHAPAPQRSRSRSAWNRSNRPSSGGYGGAAGSGQRSHPALAADATTAAGNGRAPLRAANRPPRLRPRSAACAARAPAGADFGTGTGAGNGYALGAASPARPPSAGAPSLPSEARPAVDGESLAESGHHASATSLSTPDAHAALESQVLHELQSHRTASYIRDLEHQRAHYSRELQKQGRRIKELRHVIDAQKRLLARGK